MPEQSAGILLYRRSGGAVEVLLVHPGGPFWARKDVGAWSIPKGELGVGEDPLDAACREFEEETGATIAGPFRALTPVRQRGGKVVTGFAVEGDFDPAKLRSNSVTIEWPRGSGLGATFPEVDRAAWFPVAEALTRINPAQRDIIVELRELLGASQPSPPSR